MSKVFFITVLIMILPSSSCMYYLREPDRHRDFMSHCDCIVYKNEIRTENFDFGSVEFIDTSKASECVRNHLKHVYLLYYDTICVAVYNDHPNSNIKLIEGFIKAYQTDTTKLSDFVKFDSSIRISISRLCKDKSSNTYYGKYVDWRDIEYSYLTKPFNKTKDDLITTWYRWAK